uniref:Structural maintenance of chromosomes protein n=2 Tax=Strongyloides stercoralis TaxID=6248 RepID=A0AAF5D5L7_STRER
MKLKFVHFFNFKTYRGEVTLGPLAELNGIVGGNGSGKSNIIDGVIFALNADGNKLRVNRMDFLIHGSNTMTPLSNNCSVELEFWEEEAKVLTLKRKLFYNFGNKRSWSEYEINGENVSLDEYKLELNRLNLGKLDNVVIGQGDIGFIIKMDPQQITAYLEELTGNGEIVERYNLLAKELDSYESQIEVLGKSKKDCMEERKVLEVLKEKEHKSNIFDIELQDNIKKRVNLETLKFLLTLSLKKEQLTLCEKDIDRKNEKIQESEKKLKEHQSRIGDLNKNKKVCHTNLLQQKKDIGKLINLLHRIEAKYKTKSKWIKENLKKQAEYINEEKYIKERIAKIDTQILEHETELEKARKDYQSVIEDDLHRINMINEFKDLDSKYKSENSFLEFLIKNSEASLKQLEKDKEVNSSKLQKLLPKKFDFESVIKNLDDDIKNLENEKKGLESKLNENKNIQEAFSLDANNISDEIKEIENSIYRVKIDIARKDKLKKVASKDSRTKEIVKKLRNEFGNNILGRIEDLLKCEDPLYSSLFYSYIFNMRNTIVVKDFDSVVNCVKFINDSNIERTNILSLDSLSIAEDVIGSSEIYTSDKYRPIKPLVTTDVEEAEKLIDYVCNNILFCTDIDVAISLRRDNRFNKCKIVVNDGTIFFTNRIQLNAMPLNILNEIDGFNEKILELSSLEQQLGLARNRECEASIKLNEIELKIKNIEADIKVKNNILSKKLVEKTRCINEFECLEFEENLITQKISKIDEELSLLKQKLDDSINSKKLLRDSIFHDFMEKYGVESLDSQNYLSTAPDFLKLICKIQDEINLLHEEKKSLELSDFSKQLLLIETELEGSKNEVEDLKNTIEELSNSIAEINKKITDNEASIESYDNELEVLNKSVKELKSCLDVLRTDSTKAIESLKLQIADLQKKILLNAKEYTYISVDENFTVESFDKSYLIDTYGARFEKSLDDLLNKAIENEENVKAEIKKLDFSDAQKLQYESLKEKFLSLDNEFDEIRLKKKKCFELFRKVKIERKINFQKMYNVLNAKMEEFMRKLFRSFDCSLYIQCNMTSIEPYLEGTYIYCKLPTKQLRELSQLSTGEKKIISLSMILACHQITLSPFLIFDEVDANMDHERLEFFVATLKSLQSDVQFIIVSHIEEVFNQCDMLFGTVDHQDNRMQVTEIFIVDMREYN